MGENGLPSFVPPSFAGGFGECSFAGLGVVRAFTKASWMESLVGTICAVGTGGATPPRDQRLEVVGSSVVGFMEIIDSMWAALEHIGVPMPRAQFQWTVLGPALGFASAWGLSPRQ